MKRKRFIIAALLGICMLVSAAEEIVRVRAQGIGATFDDAVRSACRTAVGHVTGTICKEFTQIQEDQVKQTILMLSSGFVTSYEVESTKKIDRGIEVIIRANVLREKLTQRLLAFSSGEAPLLAGETLPPQMSPREKQRRDFSRMLIYLLDDYARIFQIIPVNKVVSQQNGKPCVFVNFYLAMNPRDYRMYFNDLQKNLIRMGFRTTQKSGDFSIQLHPMQKSFYTPKYKVDNNYLFQYYNFNAYGLSNTLMRQLVLQVELLAKNGEKITSGDFRIMRPLVCSRNEVQLMGIRKFVADPQNPLRMKCTVCLPVITMDEGDLVERIRYSLRFDSGKDAKDCYNNRGQFVTE